MTLPASRAASRGAIFLGPHRPWEEAKHPRGKGGKWVRKGFGQAGPAVSAGHNFSALLKGFSPTPAAPPEPPSPRTSGSRAGTATPSAEREEPEREEPSTTKKGSTPFQDRQTVAKTAFSYSGPLKGGINGSHIIVAPNGMQAVFKPSDEESSGARKGITVGTYWRREIAASEIADIMGFGDLVPTTVEKTVRIGKKSKRGSAQEFVPETDTAINSYNPWDGEKDAIRAAAFDYLIGNNDRHMRNWLLRDKDDSMVLIDHGFSFSNTMYEFGLKMFMERAVTNDWPVPDMTKLAGRWPEVEAVLKRLEIEPDAIALTKGRFKNLTSGKYENFNQLASAPLGEPIKASTMAHPASTPPRSSGYGEPMGSRSRESILRGAAAKKEPRGPSTMHERAEEFELKKQEEAERKTRTDMRDLAALTRGMNQSTIDYAARLMDKHGTAWVKSWLRGRRSLLGLSS